MNRQRNQSFGADLYGPQQYRPDAVQLQTNQLHHNEQGLRDALFSAIQEVKSLKEERKSLEEKTDLQQNEWKQVESQLQEELRQKDELLKRSIKKRQAQTRAHVDVLALLALKELELESKEEEWRAKCGALEAKLQVQREEDWSRKVQQLEQQESQEEEEEEETLNEQEGVESQKEEKNKDEEKVEEEEGKTTDDKQTSEKKKNKPKKNKRGNKKNRY